MKFMLSLLQDKLADLIDPPTSTIEFLRVLNKHGVLFRQMEDIQAGRNAKDELVHQLALLSLNAEALLSLRTGKPLRKGIKPSTQDAPLTAMPPTAEAQTEMATYLQRFNEIVADVNRRFRMNAALEEAFRGLIKYLSSTERISK